MTSDQEMLPQHAAAIWHSRLQQAGDCAELRREFAQWLAQSPQHRTAYEGIDRAWRTLRANSRHPAILGLRRETVARRERSVILTARTRHWAAIAASVLGICALAALLLMQLSAHSPFLAGALRRPANEQVYDTGIGGRRVVLLSDGSRVTLDALSEVRVAFTAQQRDVSLTRGQALFEVAKDHDHPFVVTAGVRRFIAVGTAFDVRMDSDHLMVTMVEGTVRVESATPLTDPPAGQVTITAGEQFMRDAQQRDRVVNADVGLATGWLHDQIVFDNTKLAAAVMELNRYSAVRIELGAPALAGIRISGTFNAKHSDLFVEALTSYYPMDVVRNRNAAVLMPR